MTDYSTTLSTSERLSLIDIIQSLPSADALADGLSDSPSTSDQSTVSSNHATESNNATNGLTNSLTNDSTKTVAPKLWLLGTLGCHLCHDSDSQLKQLQAVIDFDYQTIDIIDLPEPWMTQLATQIPVLISIDKQLNYPFSILDIQALLSI